MTHLFEVLVDRGVLRAAGADGRKKWGFVRIN